jgi:hypothetical protein
VCGGRNYADYWTVYDVLTGLHTAIPIRCIIEGGALGADRFARQWAIDRSILTDQYPVISEVDGPWPAAGPRRNQRMLIISKPDLVVAFPGGTGTADMVRRAHKASVTVMEIEDCHGP